MATLATLTTNKDVDYIQKDFASAADAMISFATVNYGPGTSANRLWTNFNVDSFSRNWLEIVAFVTDAFFFYFDVQATQAYLQTATIMSAVKDIAKQFGFTPATAASASGNASFTINAAGVVSRGFRVKSSTGQEFYLTADIVAGASGTYIGTVLQGAIKTENFTAVGLQNEEFNLVGPNVIRDLNNLNPQDRSPQVSVAGNIYTLVTSFLKSNGDDSPPVLDSLGEVIGGGGRVFTLEERPDGTPFIRFGDGVFGRKVSPGEAIIAIYRNGGGSAGNIGAQSLNTLVDNSAIVTSVTNSAKFSGGSDAQTIEQLRDLIPASLRTLERAVSETDYSDLLKVNFSEVFAASTEANTVDPGVDINIYVVPNGTGITQISTNTLLKNKLSNFIDVRKMVTTQFQILDAFGISVLVTLEVFITNTTSRATVTAAINTALTNYFSLTTGGVNGSGVGFAEKILLKDMNNLIEAIDGIDRFEIKRLSYRPRIAQNTVGLLTTYEASDVTIFPNISESEWLAGAEGAISETAGTILFSNDTLTGFSYNSGTGLVTYTFPVDLRGISPGDQFRDGANVDFTILGVDTTNSTLYLSKALTVNTTVSTVNHGSIRNAATSYQSYKVFKKINAIATNLSIDNITDNNLDLSLLKGTGSGISARVLLDNSQVFVPGEWATGAYYLVDAVSNIWEIVENGSNTLKTSISAVNDAAITSVASGAYKIVKKLVGRQVVFNGEVFNIQYNSDNTMYSIGGQFNQIGTISDPFQISELQVNRGNFGIPADIITYNSGTKEIRLNGNPDLSGVNSSFELIDSSGQIFNVTSVDDRAQPSVIYDPSNTDTTYILESSGLGSQWAQGFKVPTSSQYAVVSFNLKREGNAVGNLVAKIVNDLGGLPNLGSVVAASDPVDVTKVGAALGKVVFPFTTPPTLVSGTQYHLVIAGDAAYSASQQNNIKNFDNTGLVGFSYTSISGVIAYGSPVNLSNVVPGNYFRDGLGTLFQILAVDDSTDSVTIATGQSVDNTVSTSDDGAIFADDNIILAADASAPTYVDGEASRFDGALWSNSTLGPSQLPGSTDLIFTVEGPKTIKIDSNLTPVLGSGATLAIRYYDDENQLSFILGSSGGIITSAPDVNALGKGTVISIPNTKVDHFIFRSSPYADDIVNLRFMEIPTISTTDIALNLFGGVQ